ncbi:hypothetical protein IG631_23079 [Alternaria alternata]|nr:hypothetical protein IG631_23079 [Alternaria alternata]
MVGGVAKCPLLFVRGANLSRATELPQHPCKRVLPDCRSCYVTCKVPTVVNMSTRLRIAEGPTRLAMFHQGQLHRWGGIRSRYRRRS